MPESNPIGHRFGLQAIRYDQVSRVQRMLAQNLWDATKPYLPTMVDHAFDVGCGTGHMALHLASAQPMQLHLLDLSPEMLASAHARVKAEFPGQDLAVQQGDAEKWTPSLRFSHNSVVATSATLQWFSNLPGFMQRMAANAEPGALFAFATFGPETLEELHDAYQETMGKPLRSGAHMLSMETLVMAMTQLGLTILENDRALHQAPMESPRALMHELKQMGVTGGNHAPTLTRERLRALEDAIRRNATQDNGKLACTWELVWVVARK